MLVGIVSDSHDRHVTLKTAINLLQQNGAAHFIHCGDVGGQTTLDQLAGLKVTAVWGNNDWDRTSLDDYARSLGIIVHDSLAEVELGGKKFAVIHGDDLALKLRLLDEQRHDYLLQGHTHVREDQRVGRIRIINPGALFRARTRSVALLNTETDAMRFFEVDGQ